MSQFTPSTERFPAVLRKRAMVSALVLLVIGLSALPASAQSANGQLTFLNNYFVTGDYVVGGVGLRGLGDATGYAKGYIRIPDGVQPNAAAVPDGADIVAAFLYWETVESSLTTSPDGTYVGQKGFFNGYPILGTSLGDPNSPVSWSSGGCSGASGGSKIMRTYRADVRSYLPVDAQGHIQANSTTGYEIRLPDSGSNGGGVPLTLGATLVVVYRVLDKIVPPGGKHYPLNAIIFYDGAYSPSNGSATMSLSMQGFYQPSLANVSAKITHIAGNGQSNKYQLVNFGGNPLPSLYPRSPSFPGMYNGSWDNPTWDVSSFVSPSMTSFTTSVTPTSSNAGCVSWPAVVVSTTVQAGDDGLLDVWKQNGGYCDASINQGVCQAGNSADPAWVSLNVDGAPTIGGKDLYVQVDYLCTGSNGVCDPNGESFPPNPAALAMVKAKFLEHGITVHYDQHNAIVANACTDQPSATPPTYCSFPDEPAVVGWKGGYEFIKRQYFQHGRKDSYHYALFANAVGRPRWRFLDGGLISITGTPTTATFTTAEKHKLQVGDRVTVTSAISNPYLNGLYFVSAVTDYTFTIPVAAPNPSYKQYPYNRTTDPFLAVAPNILTSASGLSDIGGADSLITLGKWGEDGKKASVQAGTFMHEQGHSLALTHGGYYYDATKGYISNVEANCKPNYLSIMNYLFQVDLLGPDGTLDFSTQNLALLNEGLLGLGISTTDGSDTEVTTTKWYDPVPAFGVGTPAKRYCDGRSLPVDASGNPTVQMYLREGPEPPPDSPSATIVVPWTTSPSAISPDVNFDGTLGDNLQGFNDWISIDLRQVGATGSDAGGGRLGDGGGRLGDGGGRLGDGGGRLGDGGGRLGDGGGRLGDGGGVLGGELTHETANSVVRPPRKLQATPHDTRSSHEVRLDWLTPSFGQIDHYNIYRSDKLSDSNWPKHAASNSYTDTSSGTNPLTDCTTFTYYVSAVLALQPGEALNRESVPSNSVTYTVPCPPRFPLAEPNGAGSVKISWTAPLPDAGDIYAYRIYRNDDASPLKTVLAPATGTTDDTVVNNTTYTYHITAVPLNNQGCTPNDYCRESSEVSISIAVHFLLPQTITFDPLLDKKYGDPDFGVSATASSGLTVSFGGSGQCTVSGTTVHITGAGSCTVTASQAGNNDYYPAPDVPRSFTIAKADPIISVTGYSVTYDGNPHTATGTAKGVFNESLSGLDLGGTTHTNAGAYSDSWAFTDVTGNYNNANGTVSDSIAKANPTIVVTAYTVTYDGNAHTASGTATGVKGEALAGLNLAGTTHTNAGAYSDSWAFTDVTGNYNNANGGITDTIAKGNTITTIASTSPNPSILGQSITVNFTVSPFGVSGTPTGSVTVSDGSGATCAATLSQGKGSCLLALTAYANGKPLVGTRPVTATYGGDANFAGSASAPFNHKVYYSFTGFLPQLSMAGDTSYSGVFNLSKSITTKWTLQDSGGNYVVDLNANILYAVGPFPKVGGKCPLPFQAPLATAAPLSLVTVLYSPTTGAKGGSTFRIGSSQFVFNWDTKTAAPGCYILELDLNSDQVMRTGLQLQ